MSECACAWSGMSDESSLSLHESGHKQRFRACMRTVVESKLTLLQGHVAEYRSHILVVRGCQATGCLSCGCPTLVFCSVLRLFLGLISTCYSLATLVCHNGDVRSQSAGPLWEVLVFLLAFSGLYVQNSSRSLMCELQVADGDSESGCSSSDHNMENSLLDNLVHVELEPAVLVYMLVESSGPADPDSIFSVAPLSTDNGLSW